MKSKAYIQDVFCIFAIVCALLIPFPFHLFPLKLSDILFGRFIVFLADTAGIMIVHPEISSDSVSMYLLFLILFILALIITLILRFSAAWQRHRERILPLFNKFLVYYLALQLMKYGFDKVFRKQFYTPEPNILYTPFGQLDKDILFWSTMGTSYLYSIVTGLAEVLAGIFLVFKKTRVVGLILSVFLLTHVLLINLSFDISVKLFSLFLLFLALLLLAPQAKRLYSFFIVRDINTLAREQETFPLFYHALLRVSLKTFIIGIMFLEALYPAFSSRNFNDDVAQRPFLHGSYEVVEEKNEYGAVKISCKRFFIHRDGYVIFQDVNDKTMDYKMQLNTKKSQLVLYDRPAGKFPVDYEWNASDKMLTLEFFRGTEDYLYLRAKAIDWKKLPVLQQQFHWTVDEAAVSGDR